MWVFPAYAGVIRGLSELATALKGFPRIRGGDPFISSFFKAFYLFSPHTRG